MVRFKQRKTKEAEKEKREMLPLSAGKYETVNYLYISAMLVIWSMDKWTELVVGGLYGP